MMLLDLAALVLSQIGVSGGSLYVYHRLTKPNSPPKSPIADDLEFMDLINAYSGQTKILSYEPPVLSRGVGLEVQSDDAAEEVITAEEHLYRLILLYPEAAEAYEKKYSHLRLNNRADRYILRMIMEVDAGNMSVKKTSHHMEFSNGDEIWTSNKYYSYGNLDKSPDNPQCTFSSSDCRVSLYTFMRIVHLEETEFEPILRLKNKTIKVI